MVKTHQAEFDLTEKSRRMGNRLIAAGVIDERQLDLALQEQSRTGGYLSKLLDELGFASENRVVDLLASDAGAETIDIRQTLVEPHVIARVPYDIAKRSRAMPLEINEFDSLLTVAMADPTDVTAIDQLENATGLRLNPLVATEGQISDAIYHHYEKQGSVQATIDEILRKSGHSLKSGTGAEEEAPVIELVDQILGRASEIGASDIHIEPEEKILRIRMRVDGILHQELLIPKSLQPAVIARVKIIGRLDLTEYRIPQDGRTTCSIGNREISMRISTLPTAFGENVVMRLLDSGNLKLDLNSVGFSDTDLDKFNSALKQPHGVILITGPTGSGKTTTLYSALNAVCDLDRSTFTLEDPIEYKLPIIRQTQINEEVGMTFSAGLRALLRQDPDIILVGETRDTETASLMIRAALTGHLVFSTLHTNSAVESIPRLVDMGIEPYLLPASLNAIVAQRLLRRICGSCMEPVDQVGPLMEKFGLKVPEGAPDRLMRGMGCANCNGKGYRGRLPVYEVLLIDEAFHGPIVKSGQTDTIFKLARERGMTTLFEDGVSKALQGLTTIDEVMRVVPPKSNELAET